MIVEPRTLLAMTVMLFASVADANANSLQKIVDGYRICMRTLLSGKGSAVRAIDSPQGLRDSLESNFVVEYAASAAQTNYFLNDVTFLERGHYSDQGNIVLRLSTPSHQDSLALPFGGGSAEVHLQRELTDGDVLPQARTLSVNHAVKLVVRLDRDTFERLERKGMGTPARMATLGSKRIAEQIHLKVLSTIMIRDFPWRENDNLSQRAFIFEVLGVENNIDYVRANAILLNVIRREWLWPRSGGRMLVPPI